jgi:hypothetical protein
MTQQDYIMDLLDGLVATLSKEASVEQVENTVKSCGLFPYLGWQLKEFPLHLHPYCGKGIGIWQYPNQFSKYISFIRQFPITTYVEIGVAAGGTFMFTHTYLKTFNPSLQSYAVDIGEIGKVTGEGSSPYNGLLEQYISSHPECEFVHGTSGTFANKYPSKPIDLLLIDGDHSYEGVKHDFDVLAEKSKIIVFHDICSVACPGVARFWQEIKAQYPNNVTEFVDQYNEVPNSYLGIGVLVKTDDRT